MAVHAAGRVPELDDLDLDRAGVKREKHGVIVNEVRKDGPADKAGLKADDIITGINGQPVKDGDELVARVADLPVGSQATLSVDRDGKKMDFKLAIQDRTKVFADDPRIVGENAITENGATKGEAQVKFGISIRAASEEERDLTPDKHGIAITRVERRLARDAGARVPLFPPIYYAVCRSTLTAALGEETLRHRIDDCLDGRLPRLEAKPKVKRAEAGADSSPGAQLVADVDLPSGGALSSIAGGLIEQLAAPDDGASAAEAIFRGAPGLDAAGARALAMAYLGGAPVTPEGSAYHWSEAGVVDPMRGSAHAPRATAGKTPAERLDPGLRAWVDALAHARLEISFDGEPATPGAAPMQSARFHLTVRRAPVGRADRGH